MCISLISRRTELGGYSTRYIPYGNLATSYIFLFIFVGYICKLQPIAFSIYDPFGCAQDKVFDRITGRS